MCGIVGFTGKNPVDNIKLKILTYLSEERGKEGTGLGYIKDGQFYEKKMLVPPKEFIPSLSPNDINSCFIHTRNSRRNCYSNRCCDARNP